MNVGSCRPSRKGGSGRASGWGGAIQRLPRNGGGRAASRRTGGVCGEGAVCVRDELTRRADPRGGRRGSGGASPPQGHLIRERSCPDACLAFSEAVRRWARSGPTWPSGCSGRTPRPVPPSHARPGGGGACPITSAWRPVRAPELKPGEDRWRLMKAVVAANRCASSLEDRAQPAAAWLAALTPDDPLRCSGLLRTTVQWLSI